jgi:hypothetical protein
MRGQVRQSRRAPARHRQHPGAHGAQHAGPFRLDLGASSISPRCFAAFNSARSACAAAKLARSAVAFASGIARGDRLETIVSILPKLLEHRVEQEALPQLRP